MRNVAFCRLLFACGLFPVGALAQFTVTGVADKTTYNDMATLTVLTQAGYRYGATLNWKPIALGVAVVVNKPDFYELRVDATNQATSAVTNRYLRFHVLSSERVGSEWGLPPHTPFPVIQSSSNEFAGAHLRLIHPASFPVGYAIPLVAWAMDDQLHAVRGNGWLRSSGADLFQVKRGAGSGFITHTNASGTLGLNFEMAGLTTNASIGLETSVAWTSVSGTLAGATVWPDNSRIHVTGSLTIPNGASLTIGAGSILRLNSRVDITNNGTVTIDGVITNAVVFMAATNGQRWGGFVMKNSGQGIVKATGTIFVGAGAEPTWFGANGNPGSHRVEQSLFYCDAGQQLDLTDCAAFSFSGQLGHSRAAPITTVNLTRFLMQRLTTGGEWTGARFTVNDSAFIECPDDSANFVDGDNDALYIVDGTHFFTNTLFGWTKDDGIDSGGGGYGPLTYQSCWFEAIFHEGNSLSGYKNVLARDTVYFDCGQGIEDGYNAPTGRLDHCFFSMCQAGIRHGDNYPTIGNYDGRLTATNCISIYNHRDLFGFNWRTGSGWTNSYDRFFVSNNFVSVLDTNYPNNLLWNPANDGWRLGSLGGAGRVGVGFGARGNSLAVFPDGLPVGLSRFCTNEVRVDYTVDSADGAHSTGTLVFPAGLTRNYIPLPTNFTDVLRVGLLNPQHADITGASAFLMQNVAAPATSVTLSPLGAAWKYLDNGSEQGTPWRGTNFNDAAWSSGVGRLGFGSDANAATTVRRYVTGTSGPQITNYYFRRAFTVTNPAAFTNVMFRSQRDDGCVVYLNGGQIFTNNMPPPPITANLFASSTVSPQSETARFWTNLISASLLHAGTNWIAAEVHQATATSSDLAWECEVIGMPQDTAARMSIARLGDDAVIYWTDATFGLEAADVVTGPWRPAATNSPAGSTIISNRFFRLRK